MKLILPAAFDKYSVIVYPRDDGEQVIEVTDRPGNCGTRGELLEDAGTAAGKIYSFKEATK